MPRIAIPMPHSLDREYAERGIVQYERAVEGAGGEAVRIPLDCDAEGIRNVFESCDGVVLPGSKADVDPAKYGAERSLKSAVPDSQREAVDTLLLHAAYEKRKPVFGICYGLQSLNVFRGGSLVQHIPDFLPEGLRGRIDHEAGRKVQIAHTVEIEPASSLAAIVGRADLEGRSLPVNSSHHQSAELAGRGLRVSARCREDGIIEALEGTDGDHFVIAVQWHPERTVEEDHASRALFSALIKAAKGRLR